MTDVIRLEGTEVRMGGRVIPPVATHAALLRDGRWWAFAAGWDGA